MSGVEQNERQTAIIVEENEVPEVDENTSAITAELVQDKDETQAVVVTSSEALADAEKVENVEVPHTEDAVVDIEAEPHTVKVLSEEAEHEAVLPSCFRAGSVSSPSNADDVKQSSQNDTAVPPTTPAVDGCGVQDNSYTSDCADELKAADASMASKETTEEGKVGSASDSDANSSDQEPKAESQVQEKTQSANGTNGIRTFRVLAVPPQDLFFVAPPDCKPGQPVWIQGPHGPLQVQAPANVKPGQRVTVRLAAPFQHEVLVPEGAKAGDTVTFKGENGEQLQAIVPLGKKPGQTFRASPPVTMLRVPEGAIPGDQLLFKVPIAPQVPSAPNTAPAPGSWFKELATTVPPNMAPGTYFAAMIDEASRAEAQEEKASTSEAQAEKPEKDDLVWI